MSRNSVLNCMITPQVLVTIDDVNDNPPEFDSPTVHISVAENIALSTTIYAAHARDRDSGVNGEVTYRLVESGPPTFRVDPRLGLVMLVRPLDFEKAARHSVLLVATDAGSPPLSTNLTVNVDVQDVNDNAPVFERDSYSVAVSESKPIGSQVNFFQLTLHTLPHLKCIGLVSVRSCLRCINIGVRIELI